MEAWLKHDLEEGYVPKQIAKHEIQFNQSGTFSYALLDSNDVILWSLEGPVVLHGEHITCPVTAYNGQPMAGGKVVDGTWSLTGNQLLLTNMDAYGNQLASVTYTK